MAGVKDERNTVAIRKATKARLRPVSGDTGGRSLAAEMLEIGARCAALPDLDTRSADEILGYDDHGLPH